MIFPGTLRPFRKPGYIFVTACNTSSGYSEYTNFLTCDEFTPNHLAALYYLDNIYDNDGNLDYGDMPAHLRTFAFEFVDNVGWDYSLTTVLFIDSSGVIHDVEFDLESLPTTNPELFL